MGDLHPHRLFREKSKLSQEELAERIGVSKASVSRWESRARIPEPRLWERIREVTGGEVTANDFTPAAASPSKEEAA